TTKLEDRAMELLLERTLGNQSAIAVAPRLSLIPKIGAVAASVALVALLVWQLVDRPAPSPEPHGDSHQQPGVPVADGVGGTADKPEVKDWMNATDFREESRRKTYLPASAEEAAQLLAQAESITIYN